MKFVLLSRQTTETRLSLQQGNVISCRRRVFKRLAGKDGRSRNGTGERTAEASASAREGSTKSITYSEAKVDVTQEIEQSLHQLGQPVAPSVLFPVLHPL